MKVEIQQSIKLTQQLLMTPQLQQAIKLLQLSKLELENFIQNQISENPALEEVEEDRCFESEKKLDEQDVFELQDPEKNKLFEWSKENASDTPSEVFDEFRSYKYFDEINYENFITYKRSLSEHLLLQLGLKPLTKNQKKIASLIIGSLSDQGFLECSIEEITTRENLDYNEAKNVLKIVQSLDPIGIAAHDLQESLLIQLRAKGYTSKPIEKIIENHFHSLLSRDYRTIAKKLNISNVDVRLTLSILSECDFSPAANFNISSNPYIVPDLFVYKENNQWAVSLNEEGFSGVRVNSYYQKIYKNLQAGEDKNYLSEKIRDARWLVKSIEQRKKTIFLVMSVLLEKQKDFFENGFERLRPLVLKDIAEVLNMHESTISRVTTNKYVHTPLGVFELKYFFSSSLTQQGSESLASESVRAQIKQIILSEPSQKPYSDQKITDILNERGIVIARRTVTKYREKIGILTASKRKNFKLLY